MNEAVLSATARLFKVLGNESRLCLLELLGNEEKAVGALAEEAGLSQPLVSQHLRTLREAGLLRVERRGKEMLYSISDHHVKHVVEDAFIHAQEHSRKEES